MKNIKNIFTKERVISAAIGLLAGALITTSGYIVFLKASGRFSSAPSKSEQSVTQSQNSRQNRQDKFTEQGEIPDNGKQSQGENNSAAQEQPGQNNNQTPQAPAIQGEQPQTPPDLPQGEQNAAAGENGEQITAPQKPDGTQSNSKKHRKSATDNKSGTDQQTQTQTQSQIQS